MGIFYVYRSYTQKQDSGELKGRRFTVKKQGKCRVLGKAAGRWCQEGESWSCVRDGW